MRVRRLYSLPQFFSSDGRNKWFFGMDLQELALAQLTFLSMATVAHHVVPQDAHFSEMRIAH